MILRGDLDQARGGLVAAQARDDVGFLPRVEVAEAAALARADERDQFEPVVDLAVADGDLLGIRDGVEHQFALDALGRPQARVSS